jgi:hypothetical protein
MSRRLDVDEALRALEQARRVLVLLADVDAALAVDPTATANEICARLRASGLGHRRAETLSAVLALRTFRGHPEPRRGPGRPQRGREPFSQGREA